MRRFCCDSESIQKSGGIGENRGSVKHETTLCERCRQATEGWSVCRSTKASREGWTWTVRHHCTIGGTIVQYAAPVYNMHLSCPQASLHSAASAEHTEFAIRPLRRLDFDLLVVSRCRLYYAESLVFVIFSGQFVLTQRWGKLRPQQLFTR